MHTPKVEQMKTVLVVLGSGGHTAEMLRLVDMLGPKYRYVFLLSDDDEASAEKVKRRIRLKVRRPTKRGWGLGKTLGSILKSFFQSHKLISDTKFDMIVGCGPGICIFPMFFARLRGKKVVFVETLSRVHTHSWTGRMMYKFADLFYVQWKEQLERYPKAIYRGRLL